MAFIPKTQASQLHLEPRHNSYTINTISHTPEYLCNAKPKIPIKTAAKLKVTLASQYARRGGGLSIRQIVKTSGHPLTLLGRLLLAAARLPALIYRALNGGERDGGADDRLFRHHIAAGGGLTTSGTLPATCAQTATSHSGIVWVHFARASCRHTRILTVTQLDRKIQPILWMATCFSQTEGTALLRDQRCYRLMTTPTIF